MGIIFRNGVPYGGDEVIEAAPNEILVGDGGKWTKGSTFFCGKYKLPTNFGWDRYRNQEIGIIGTGTNMVVLSGRPTLDGLNPPLIAAAGLAKVFFEDTTDIDISGDNQTYIHGKSRINIDNNGYRTRSNTLFDISGFPTDCPVINIHGNSVVNMNGQPMFNMADSAVAVLEGRSAFKMASSAIISMEGISRLKMDDYALFQMENGAGIRLTGLVRDIAPSDKYSSDDHPPASISPALMMDCGSTFIMNGAAIFGRDDPRSPLLIAEPTDFTFMGYHGTGRETTGHGDGLSYKVSVDNSSICSTTAMGMIGDSYGKCPLGISTADSFKAWNPTQTIRYNTGQTKELMLKDEPIFRVGAGAHMILDGSGHSFIKISPESGSTIRAFIDPAKDSLFDMKLSPNTNGRIVYILEGKDVFIQHEDNVHLEFHDNSNIIMRGRANTKDSFKGTPWSDGKAEFGKTDTTHLNKDWSRPIKAENGSPTCQMYDESNFIMRGTWTTVDAPDGWKEHPDRAAGSPLFECYDEAEIRIGSATIKADRQGVEINGVKFTNEQLQKLLDLVK